MVGLIPVAIGLIGYYYLGSFLYVDVLNWGKSYIEGQISSSGWSSFFYWILVGILTVAFWFTVSWTYILTVSIIASPFHDFISARVEKNLRKLDGKEACAELPFSPSKVFFIIINEIKKMALILSLSALGLILSFIPFLAPVSVAISALLLAAGYIDYSWSRHNWNMGRCFSDLKGGAFSYIIAGFVFLGIVAVPIVNVFALPYAVVYFTILYWRRNAIELT
jgi:CysZ protein